MHDTSVTELADDYSWDIWGDDPSEWLAKCSCGELNEVYPTRLEAATASAKHYAIKIMEKHIERTKNGMKN